MRNETELRAHCFVNSKIEGDDFVGVKSDGTALSVHFPLGYYFPEDDRCHDSGSPADNFSVRYLRYNICREYVDIPCL